MLCVNSPTRLDPLKKYIITYILITMVKDTDEQLVHTNIFANGRKNFKMASTLKKQGPKGNRYSKKADFENLVSVSLWGEGAHIEPTRCQTKSF